MSSDKCGTASVLEKEQQLVTIRAYFVILRLFHLSGTYQAIGD